MTTPDPRDRELEGAWRDASRDGPPRHLDDAILARAREAVSPRKEEPPSELWPLSHPRSWFMRWRVPLAVAATLVVSATVTLLVYDSGMEEPPPVVIDRPLRKAAPPPGLPAPAGAAKEQEAAAPAPVSPAPAAPTVDTAKPSTDATKPPAPAQKREAPAGEPQRAQPEAPTMGAPASAESGRVVAPQPKRAEEALGASREAPAPPPVVTPAPSAAPAPPAAPAPSTAPVPEHAPAAAGAVAPTAPRAAPAPMAAPPRPAAQGAPRDNAVLEKRDESSQAAPAARAKAAAFATPEAYVERIRELRRVGRDAEARELLDELHRRFPAFELPDDLKVAR